MHSASISGQAAMALPPREPALGTRPDWRLMHGQALGGGGKTFSRMTQVALAYRPGHHRLTGFAYHPVQAAGGGVAKIGAAPGAWSRGI